MSPRVVSVYPETGHRATRKDCVVPDCSGKLSPPSLRRVPGVTNFKKKIRTKFNIHNLYVLLLQCYKKKINILF